MSILALPEKLQTSICEQNLAVQSHSVREKCFTSRDLSSRLDRPRPVWPHEDTYDFLQLGNSYRGHSRLASRRVAQ